MVAGKSAFGALGTCVASRNYINYAFVSGKLPQAMAAIPVLQVAKSLRISQTSKRLSSSLFVGLSRRHNASRSSRPDVIIRKRPQTSRTLTTTCRLGQSSPPSPSTSSTPAAPTEQQTIDSSELTSGLGDNPLPDIVDQVDWSRSFHGLSKEAFSKEASKTLLAPLDPEDVEIKPDGILYLPEIKYRRILNKAFGPGGWGMAPRGETIVTSKAVTREYSLVALGRLVSIARGEQDYFSPDGIPTAAEGCKSNALMRCCKDIGIASELWDPRFIRKFHKENVQEVWAEHVVTKKKKKIYLRKGLQPSYPYKAS